MSLKLIDSADEQSVIRECLTFAYHLAACGDFEPAQRLCDRVLRRDSKNVEAINNLGIFLSKEGYPAVAHPYFNKVVMLGGSRKNLDKCEMNIKDGSLPAIHPDQLRLVKA